MKEQLIVLSAFLVMAFVIGCSKLNKTGYEHETSIAQREYGIERFHDKEHNIVCYTVYSSGISCIKLEDK